LLVIPAKAGIHFAVALGSASQSNGKIKMDPGFRRDDGSEFMAPF
jgi:hypothetical protein